MATATHIPTKLIFGQAELSSTLGINFDDTTAAHWAVGLVVAGSGIPSTISTGIQFISDVTGTNAELSYSGYARQTLSGITLAYGGTAGTVDWSFSNITWAQNANDPGTGRYGFIAWLGPTGAYADTAAPVAAILDLGQTVSVVNGSLVLAAPAGGLIVWSGGG